MKKSDEILEKISKKEEQIQKRKAITEKFKKKLSSCADKWEIDWIQDDIKTSNNKLKDLELQLERLKEQLEKQLNIENVPKIPAIESLLDKWEDKARDYIVFCHEKNHEFKLEYSRQTNEIENLLKENGKPWNSYSNFSYDAKRGRLSLAKLKEKYTEDGKYNLSEDEFNKVLNVFEAEKRYYSFKQENEVFLSLYGDKERTERFIRDQKEVRRIDLITRVTKVVGTIKDATGLHFGYDDGINGIIIGDKCKATVSTIEAGGWNIQKYHFRVLVHPIKEKSKKNLDTKILETTNSINNAKKCHKNGIER